MFCCLQSAYTDPQSAYNNQASSDVVSGYPGQRRELVKTGGNALSVAPPQQQQQQQQQGELISVTVPPGVYPGQTIHVSGPDGSGRLVQAVVPNGCTAGSTFMVQAPPRASVKAAPTVTAFDTSSHVNQVSVLAAPVSDYSNVTAMPAPTEPAPFSQALDAPRATASASELAGKAFVKVTVPPGASVASTIQVEIPEEDRFITAQIPPNCTEFYVRYEPRRKQMPTPQPYNYNPTPAASTPSAPSGQKLLLVRVPLGASVGTTLHVQVPNEPGRMLMAQVPPGNVREFHVAYQPRGEGTQTQQQQQYPYNNNRPNNNDNSGWGRAVPAVVGGLAAGAAGAIVYDHFAHAHDGSGAYQDQGDYGGGG
jgi:hypothetical protein